MFKKEDTLIVIGKSPILDNQEVINKVNECRARFHTVGINDAAVIFKTEYFAYLDHNQKLNFNYIHPNTKIITSDREVTEKFQCEYGELYCLTSDSDKPFEEGKFAYAGFTHDVVLSWACYKGFKNIILFGVADFNSKEYLKVYNTERKFIPSESYKKTSKYYIDNLFTKYINIYTINPESALNVNRIKLEEI